MTIKNKNILISGAGIAGLTLAWWLKKYGYEPTVVEIKDSLPRGGYMIDFWGAGFDVAEKMGLRSQLGKRHYAIPKLKFVNETGKTTGHFNIEKMRKSVNYRHFNFLRSDLAEVLYDEIKNDVKFIWGTAVKKIEQNEDGVQAWFENGHRSQYNLVVGADGVHSELRKLTFGDEEQYEKYLHYYTASFTINNFLNDDQAFISYSVPGKQAGIYSVGHNRLSTFFVFQQEKKLEYDYHDIQQQKKILEEQFADAGWRCDELISRMNEAPDFYFDSVSQIELDQWSKGRVTLAGDACQCVSLVAGQGSALAMAGAYVLAGELRSADGDFEKAFTNYQDIMIPEIRRKQKMATKFASSFVPKTKFGIWMRDKISNLMFLPLISKWFAKRFLLDSLKLKNYSNTTIKEKNQLSTHAIML